MKYIKKFETISQDIKRGDIIIDKGLINYVYLVLDDVQRNKRKINCFLIGDIVQGNFSPIGLEDLEDRINDTLYKNANISFLNKKQIDLLTHDIWYCNEYKYYDRLNIIKEKTGIDLSELKEYKEYLHQLEIKKAMNKYNL